MSRPDPLPLPKKPAAVFHHPLGFELFDRLSMDLYAMKYAEACIAAEREACAKLCDEESELANMQANNGGRALDDGRAIGAEACAEAIRVRSNAALTGAEGVRVEGTVRQQTKEMP